MADFTQSELEKAVHNYLLRKAANERWRERNPEKVASYRRRYNAAKWQREKAILKAAKELGLY